MKMISILRGILLLPQPVCVFHAVAGAWGKLPDYVYRLGRCWVMFLPADRFLV